MPYEKEELLNAVVYRVDALEAELIATKKALYEALMKQEDLLAYINGQEDAKYQTRNLLRIAIFNISYIRGLFPEKYFNDKSVPSLGIERSTREEVANGCSNPLRLGAFAVFARDMKVLLLEKVYVVNVLGYIAYNFIIGAYLYWGPKTGYSIYHMNNADYMFGGVTAICGVVGLLAGDVVLDHMTSTLPNAFKEAEVKEESSSTFV